MMIVMRFEGRGKEERGKEGRDLPAIVANEREIIWVVVYPQKSNQGSTHSAARNRTRSS